MDRVPFMTRSGMVGDSGGRMNHQEAGLEQEEADREQGGRPGLAWSPSRAWAHSGRAAPGRTAGRGQGEAWGWKVLLGASGGPIAKERGGSKGPNSEPGVYSVPKAKRRASRRRGGAASFPEEEELRRKGPVVTGWAGRVDRLWPKGIAPPSLCASGPGCPCVLTLPHLTLP